MRWFRRVIGGVLALVQRQRAERELDEELCTCLETAIDQKMHIGMSREQATRAARLELGLVSVDSVKDRMRDVGWESVVESAESLSCQGPDSLEQRPAGVASRREREGHRGRHGCCRTTS
jgi:hypothetical protein